MSEPGAQKSWDPGPQPEHANPEPFKSWNFEKSNRKRVKFNSRKGNFVFLFLFLLIARVSAKKNWGNDGEKRKAGVPLPVKG